MPKVLIYDRAPDAQPLDLTGLDADLAQVNRQLAVAGVQSLDGAAVCAGRDGHQDTVGLVAPLVTTACCHVNVDSQAAVVITERKITCDFLIVLNVELSKIP